MDDPIKEIVGAWFVAVGTIIAAVGSTPFKKLNDELRRDLNVWGNVLQATGNGLEADGQGEISLEKIGNEIQSIGNVTVLTGLIIEFEDESYNIVGNVLQATGNSLQAIGGIDELKASRDKVEEISEGNEEDGQIIVITGSWIQAVGSVVSLIGQIREERQEILDNNS